jgi:sporulation protein YlmC with PRC-barrel domain
MEVPLQAQVECTDGVCGSSVYVLINPIVDQVTHLVVKETVSPNTETIVPVDQNSATTADKIQLRCRKLELEKMDPFIQTSFIQEKVPDYVGNREYGVGANYYYPYVSPETTVYETVENQQIPTWELAVRRGTRVEATDGYVGKADELVINPENGHITHLIMREGHLWGKKDVTIPISAMDRTREDTLLLKVDKHQIEALPTLPVHRHWS